MRKIVNPLVIVALASCTGDERPSEPGAVIADCGPRPPQPYLAVAFQTTTDGRQIVVMDRAVYLGYQAWVDELVVWEDCAAEH